MNIQKKSNLSGSRSKLKPDKEKDSSSKNHFHKDLNIKTYKMSQKNLYNTISIKNNKSTNKNKNIYNKSNNRKQSMLSIKNDKSSKLFKINKGKLNFIPLSLNLSDEESLTKNKHNKILYNTINAINPRIKIFKNNNIIIKDINKKNKSIQNSSRMKYSHIRCNTYSPKYKENKDEYRNKSNNKKENNNNIIINFFNAPVNKYNEEFYFNNINDMTKIIKNKKMKKKVINIFNHANIKTTHKDNTKNLYPFFSSINHGINYNINNYNDFEFQIYKNKKKATISNAYENMRTIFNNRSITKKSKSSFRESLENYSNRYRRIKFIKNKRAKNISLNFKLKEENRLRTIFKRTKNYNNLNTINKNNIINIKKDHFIHSRELKTEHKTKNKHVLYNLLFKSSLKTEQNQNHSTKSKSNNKIKKPNILSFIRFNSFKSIDIERNTRKIPKFETLITDIPNHIKTTKNKFLKKSKAQILIKDKDNIQQHQKNNDMKTIVNNMHNTNLLKRNKKIKENNNALKPIILQTNNEEINNNINNISKRHSLSKDKDPRYLSEYLDEILCNLFLEEKAFFEKVGLQISSDILNSYGINPETRTCLIDSLIDLQKIFNFNERTLFITVQIFDRYLVLSIVDEKAQKIKEENLDIILTTALLIASKLEESVLYKLSDYLGILSDKYTIDDLKLMENKIMNAFDFSAVSPTVLDFFEVLAAKSKLNEEQNKKGMFLLNIILLDVNLSQISGSVIAYAIVIIVQNEENVNKSKNLIKILNSLFKKKNKNNDEYLDALSLMNNEEKMEELCNLIQVFAEGILKTEYNHIGIKFNCEKNEYLTKKNVHRSI